MSKNQDVIEYIEKQKYTELLHAFLARLEKMERRIDKTLELLELLGKTPPNNLGTPPVAQARMCQQCKRPFYPNLSEANLNHTFCCVACENGY